MLSVVILTKNEEKNIIDCIETALWADEIIIVDDFSIDRTNEIISNLENKKIKIYKNHLDLDFAKQKNYGLSKATKKWVLFIDADERITKELRDEINALIIAGDNSHAGYFIKRVDYMWGKLLKHGELGNVKLTRLIKKGSGAWVGKVHETLVIDGKVGELDSVISHYPHQTVSEFLNEINFYSTIRANELFEKKTKVSGLNIVLYPLAKFVLNYVFKLGFLDKIEGLVIALMMSFHSFLVRSKLWLLWQKKSTS
jgi:glycosyltransferase involved in cell wall biosynthesis